MSAFEEALAAAQRANGANGSASSLSIRGTAPSSRGLASALRGAGLKKTSAGGMEVDGEGGRHSRGAGAGAGARRLNVRAQGPLDQTGRHRPPPNKPYDNSSSTGGPSNHNRNHNHRNQGGSSTDNNNNSLSARLSRPKRSDVHPGRLPEGTPPILKRDVAERRQAQADSHNKFVAKLKSEDMKQWLRSRLIAPGVLNMSSLQNDPWLKEQGILPPGHRDAPVSAGAVMWKLIDTVLQEPTKSPIYTLSLAGNDFHNLKQLSRLPSSLPYLRALDLSDNPIARVNELDELLTAGERKGKANSGAGGLKNLIELKLNGVIFREQILQKPNGDETYQHDILKRFPSLLILDGVNLNRIVFPITRQPKVRWDEQQRRELAKKPYSYPFDVQNGYIESEMVRNSVMSFCVKFFPLWDNARDQCLPAYAPMATLSICANTLKSRSIHADAIEKTRSTRPQPATFEKWTNLPGRNLLRGADRIEARMSTLHSPANSSEMLQWMNKMVPKTEHPLSDPTKWSIDAWVLDGEGTDTRLCAVIEGEFREMPSGTYRSFSRTFILAHAAEGMPAQQADFPAMVLSDTMTVHSYYGAGSFAEEARSLAINGVTITPLALGPAEPAPEAKNALVLQVCQRTRMNANFATLCLTENGWDLETAIRNFEAIKDTIPPEAFQ